MEPTRTLSPWRHVFENSAWALVVVSPTDGTIEEVNRAFAEMHGYNREELIGRQVTEMLTDDSRRMLRGYAQEVTESGRSIFESTQIRKDRSTFPVLADVIAIRGDDDDGKIAFMAAHVYDISERKKSEALLRESERHFRALAELPPQILWAANSEGEINYLSAQWYEYTGIDPARVGIREAVELAVHPDQIERIAEHWKKGVQEEKPIEFEYLLKKKSGGYGWQLARVGPVRDPKGHITAWFGVTIDIDQQRRTIERLERDQDIREQLVSTLAHDLRNPLTAAKAGAELLVRHPDNPKLRKQILDKILSNIDRVDQMIIDLLDASRIRAGIKLPIRREYCDLREEIHGALDEFALVHGPRFVLRGHETPLMGHWSCKDIRRIVENLLQNAVKYGDKNAPIVVEVSNGNEMYASIAVHNEGRPIPREELERIFDRFRRSSKSEGSENVGWGIGLTLVRGIAEAHGGTVKVESFEGKGTTFTVLLPRRILSKWSSSRSA